MLSNKYSWWAFENVLTQRFCDQVITYGNQQKEKQASVGNAKDTNSGINLKIRNSKVAWLDDAWIYKEITPFIKLANKKAGWNYDFEGQESMQFTKYSDNQYYDWHKDEWEEVNEQTNKVRKLSVTCALNDGNEYEGGNLEFQYRDYTNIQNEYCGFTKKRGSIIVFPSYVYHRVTPVLRGTRYSLVIWTLGEPWK